ncbi:MAG: hypothetical protein HKN23_07525 [Verrucomicrobiales bacterium]|nr:hypothetical protein [Verrucomicrobiales bacterium]
MKVSGQELLTPVYLKTGDDMEWPEDESVFHLLTGDGLFLCRNHPFFRSSTPVERGPAELAAHEPFIKLNYPKIPAEMFETVVGFFDLIGSKFGAEAAVLFAWNRKTEQIELVVPPQESVVGKTWTGRPFPINVYYDVPDLPDELIFLGDAHCHVEEAAFASKTDIDDEIDRPGIHIIVGRIDEEPPEIHIDVTVDGSRFHVRNSAAVIEGYQARRTDNIPSEWIDRVTVLPWSTKNHTSHKS